MSNRSLVSRHRARSVGDWLVIAFAVILIVVGAALGAGGAWLMVLGGSWYYVLAGIALVVSGALMLAGSPGGVWLYLVTYALTWVWAVWEVGFNGWALVPRVVAPSVFAILALLSLPVLMRSHSRYVNEDGRAIDGRRDRVRSHPQPAAAAIVLAIAITAALGLSVRFGSAQDNPAAPAPSASPTLTAPAANPPAGALAPQVPTQAADAASAESAQPIQTASAGDDWPAWGGTQHGMRYSPLKQINRDNVAKLEKVWTFHTGDLPDKQAKGKYSPETTPLKVGDSLYLCSAKNQIIALDAGTGLEKWRYDPKVPDDAIPYGATCRGVSYYKDPAAAPDLLCAARIIEGTLDARLIAVDAESGRLCPDFGTDGQVDLMEGIGMSVPGWYSNTAAPTIVRGIVVMGAQVQDGQAEDAPSGVIRGYDAVTGKLAWAWDMCNPSLTGMPPKGETYTRGTPNMWTSAAGDDKLGYVYVPLGNSSVDYYGGNRKDCENKFSSSLVAIDVTTGKPVWHFQTVHYDLWDYDLGSQPTLVDVPTDNGTVPAVILPSKQGQIYVLDRRTGKSLFPVEERKVPSAGVETANLSPTQPYSGFNSVDKPVLHEADMWGMSPLDQLWCRIQFRQTTYQGEYTPPTADSRFVEYPSYNGGSDWGSVAVDPEKGVVVANYNNMANFDRMITRAEADKRGMRPIYEPNPSGGEGGGGGAVQTGSPWAVLINAGWRVPFTGLMCTQPPYGGLRAIDLKTGKTLWDEPLGDARNNGPFGIASHLPITIGTPNNGGALVTAGGLIFIAATTDDMIRAIDIDTGKVLWQDKLPAGGQATPMTFTARGRQYIGFMAGGHHFMETPIGDSVIAYALPDQS